MTAPNPDPPPAGEPAEPEHDALVRWLLRVYADLTEGQRWTVALVLVLVACFVTAGLRRSAPAEAVEVPAALAPAVPITAAPDAPTAAPAAPVPTPVAAAVAAIPFTVPAPAAPLTTTSPPAPRSPAPVHHSSALPSVAVPSGPAVFATIGPPGAPGGVAVAPQGQIYVTTDNGKARGAPGASVVFTFANTGKLLATVPITGQAPDHADGLGATAVDPRNGTVYAVDITAHSVLAIDPKTHAQRSVATIPDVAPCVLALTAPPCEPGVVDHPPLPDALAVSPSGVLYVADAGQGTIWSIPPTGGTPVSWYSSTDLATGDGPAGLAFDHAGELAFTAGTTYDTAALNTGALYALPINADGSAGARHLVAAFASGARPGALALAGAADATDTAYVILRGTGSIATVRAGTVAPFPTTGTPVPLDDPSGLALAGTQLLITNRSASNNPAHWVVLRFAASQNP